MQRFNANEPEFILNYYLTDFRRRLLSENASLQAYDFDLIVLANKAYPNKNLHYPENTIICQFSKGLGIPIWYKHVLYQCPNSVDEAIDIAFSQAAVYVPRTINTMLYIKYHFCIHISQVVTSCTQTTAMFTDVSLIKIMTQSISVRLI